MADSPFPFPIFEAGELEIRRSGRTRTLSGRFNYGSMATIRDRGRVRKERFEPRAFRFAIEYGSRQIDVLVGHSFDKPLASRKAGTLDIADGDDGVTFEARLPDDPPSWVIDAERAIAAGLMTGLSPGFTIPPASAVPDAERLEPEPGNPGVQVRVIREAVLREFNVVTAPAHADAAVDLRAEHFGGRADAEAARVAVTLTEAALAEAVAVTRAQAARLLPVATAMVERYAPGAPDVMQNEAAIRVCGYLSQQPESAQRSDRLGDIETQWAPANVSALRHSGAMALLTFWKVRRAGAVSA